MTVSAYDADKYGNENRILFWLKLDKWHLHETALLFVDVDPDSFDKKFTNLITFREYTFDVYVDLESKYKDMRRILYNPDIEHDTPKNWIDRAVAKKTSIPWLEFAIEKGFYKPEDKLTQTENPLDIYRTDLLDILNLAVSHFFSPRKAQDAKKAAVAEWIKNKGAEQKINVSTNIADAMFTIIKPNDHNPKKRA